MKRNTAISPGEWKLMRRLWDEAPLTITQLVKGLQEEAGYSKASVITMLKRLEEKGAVRWQQQPEERARRYYPALPEQQAVAAETSALLEQVFQGRVGLAVSAMLDSAPLSQAELDSLSAMLAEAKERQENETRS